MTQFLLDTCTLSEPSLPRPSAQVLAWLSRHDNDDLWIASATAGEVRFGVALLDQGQKRDRLQQWSDRVLASYGPRTIPADDEIFAVWGAITAQRQRKGRALKAIDGIIAATALVRRLPLVTRDVHDFAGLDLELVNPWSS